jgi:hypothetical protein
MHSPAKGPLPVTLRLQAASAVVVLAALLGQRFAMADSSGSQVPPAPETPSNDPLLKPPLIADPRQTLIRNAISALFLSYLAPLPHRAGWG